MKFYLTQIKKSNSSIPRLTSSARHSRFQQIKNLTLFLFDSNKNRFLDSHQSSPRRGTFHKNKTKMFRSPFRASETNSNQNGFALSVCHIVISKVPRHLYNNPKPCCRFPTISLYNPFLRDCP